MNTSRPRPKKRTIKKSTTTLKNGNNLIKKKTSSIKTPMPVRPEGTTMSEPENMQTASEGIQMQEPQTGNKRGRMQEGDVSLSSPLQQQQKVEDLANMSLSPSVDEAQVPGVLPPLEEVQDSSNMSLSPSVDEAQVPGALSPVQDSANMSLSPQQQEVQEMQDSANAPLSTSGEELALGAVTPPPLKEMQDSAANAPLSPLGEEPVQNSEDVSPIPPSLEEVQDSANISLSPSSVESGAGAVEAQVPGAGAPLPLKEVENSEDVSLSQSADDAQSKLGAPPPPPLAPEMSGQEQVMQEPIDVKPVVVAEDQKEKDTIKTALLEQLKEIKEKTAQIENQLAATAVSGGMMKKRKKTFYKKYKSKKSMKRKNKTNRNK
jgi:hypothetical protein